MPQRPKELEKIGEETSEDDSRFELEDTGCAVHSTQLQNNQCQAERETVPNLKEALENLIPNDFVARTSSDNIPNCCATSRSRDIQKGKAPESLAANLRPIKVPLDKASISEQQQFFPDRPVIRSGDIQTPSLPLPIPQPNEALPRLPPVVSNGSSEVSAPRRHHQCRTRRSPACSLFCEEEEAIFPTRRWAKPLADIGDAMTWKLGVLDRFNAIRY